MASVRVVGKSLDVSFSRFERLAGLLRDVRLPLAAVQSVEVVADGYLAPRGIRAPGFSVPGRRKIGTWRTRAGRQLVCVRKSQPALRVVLHGARYERLVIGADDAVGLAAEVEGARR